MAPRALAECQAAQAIKETWYYWRHLTPENRIVEIINGELLMTPNSLSHSDAHDNLHRILSTFVVEARLGRVTLAAYPVLISETMALEPDIAFYRRDRVGQLGEDGSRIAPNLVVEILSPSTAKRDRGVKFQAYAEFGVEEYWLVDPATKTIDVFVKRATGLESIGTFRKERPIPSEVLPGLKICANDAFIVVT